jgi:hypothetical protein
MSNAGEKRQIILETASKLFSRYGFNKTSLDEIAAKAQSPKGPFTIIMPIRKSCLWQRWRKRRRITSWLAGAIDEIESFEAKLHAFLHIPISLCMRHADLIECMRNLPYNTRIA